MNKNHRKFKEKVINGTFEELTDAVESGENDLTKGKVNYEKLNVRVAPDKESNVICVISMDEAVTINLSQSTDNWYSVRTEEHVDGFCMKQFIDILI